MSLSAMDTGALTALCVGWLSVALALGLDLFGRKRRDPAFRWMGAGLLVMLSGGVLSQFTHVRRWPHDQLLAVGTVTLAVGLAGFACVIVGVVIRVRTQDSDSRASYDSR
jgi:hypothetical protein